MDIMIALSCYFIAIFIVILLIVFDQKQQRYEHLEYNQQLEKINNNQREKDEELIKILKEIAYDYKVKIFKNGAAYIISNDQYAFESQSPEFGCFGKDSKVFHGEFSEDGNAYMIAFRVIGKEYLAYGPTEVMAWAALVKTARSENIKYFSKSSYYDRQKI